MFIALVGTRFAGKSTVEDFLIKEKNFTPVRLVTSTSHDEEETRYANNAAYFDSKIPDVAPSQQKTSKIQDVDALESGATVLYRPVSFLMMNSPVSSFFPLLATPNKSIPEDQESALLFQTPDGLLDHITKNWRSDFVTVDLNTKDLLDMFVTRPFVLVVNVDAPLLIRFHRGSKLGYEESLETFINENDAFHFGTCGPDDSNNSGSAKPDTFRGIDRMVNLRVVNSFNTVPTWDTYFMKLASLASHRSNCMKRRVGAILVRNNRILSTGYNGTPRGLTNCNEGGCIRCNSASETSDECVCLHAEENALLEAGRDRVGDGSVIYCNTCPCLKCTIKIIQTGVKEVVYNLSYRVDDASAALFKQAGITLRRHAPPPED
ncbi:cytidine and deoxycytidylate deaminase family protein [Abortiporus biennis]